MKNYLSFNLEAKQLLPIWLSLYLLIIVPYILLLWKMRDIQSGQMPSPYIFLAFPILIFGAFILYYYLIKLLIQGISYNNKSLVFKGRLLNLMGTLILGLILTMVTLGIYLAWFSRDIIRFFVNNTSYDSEDMEFLGKGSDLLVIVLVTLFLPIIVAVIVGFKYLTAIATLNFAERYVFQFIQYLIMIPYLYFSYKWTVNLRVKSYIIKWRTETLPSMGKMALEICLIFITVFIYAPAAVLKLYKYFLDRTIADNGTAQKTFGFDLDLKNDFIFIWKEILLSVITLGFYGPWAYCKVNKMLFGKTFIQSEASVTEA